MQINKDSLLHKTFQFMSGRTFFVLVLLIFSVQAAWLAVSASYPMLYDEAHHVRLIDLYSEQLSPFIASQSSENISFFGELTRNPSYLFHYLLSFPYRLLSMFTDSFYVRVVGLRLINVLFVVIGLIYYKKLFIKARLSNSVVIAGLLIIISLPIFTFVAAHVNYDNLIFMLTPIFLIWGIKLLNKKEIRGILVFLTIGMFATLVKSSFLPVFAAAAVFIVAHALIFERHKAYTDITKSLKHVRLANMLPLLILFTGASVLFTERYIQNIVVYKDFSPSCSVVHSQEECVQNRIVRRNTEAEKRQTIDPVDIDNVVTYTREQWLPAMVEGLLVVGPASGVLEDFDRVVLFPERVRIGANPLSFLLASYWVLFIVSVLLLAYYWRELKKLPWFFFYVTIFGVYAVALLFLVNYTSYSEKGVAFAMQPRYLIFLLPIFVVYVVKCASIAVKGRLLRILVLVVFIGITTQGGGMQAYIVSSESNWYWQRERIIKSNDSLKSLFDSYIINSEGVENGFEPVNE